MVLTYSVVIERPVQVVWDFVTDLRNDHLWWKAVERCELVTPEPIQLGSQFTQHASITPVIKVDNHLTVTAYAAPWHFVMQNNDSGLDYEAHYLLERIADEQTRFTIYADHWLSTSLMFLSPIINRTIAQQVRTYFQDLKHYLETHA